MGSEITFYDSVSGQPLFVVPRGRSMRDFMEESRKHGWPSFRDDEVISANVRVLPDGETVSVFGTHLGHNLPDRRGNRYCINLVSVAGVPPVQARTQSDLKSTLAEIAGQSLKSADPKYVASAAHDVHMLDGVPTAI